MSNSKGAGKKIKFRNIGREKQHNVTLFEITEYTVDVSSILNNESTSAQSYAENKLTFYQSQIKDYLKNKGFEDTNGYFRVHEGKVIKCHEVWQPLWAAIEERDKANGGQSGEYLAALIDHRCTMLSNMWPPSHNNCSIAFDLSMEIQDLYFQLYLLEEIHPRYSAGKARTSDDRELKSKFEAASKKLYQEFRKSEFPKETCYQKIANELKILHPHEKNTPTARAIKDWALADSWKTELE